MPAADVPGIATPGRLIRRRNLFFRPGTKGHRKRPNAALKARERKRNPEGLKAVKPNQVIEFGMKHACLPGQKLYAFAAIDPVGNEVSADAVLHIVASSSGLSSKAALKEAAALYGRDITLANDNGSENAAYMPTGKAGKFLAEEGITRY
jgi:hypothetical protein